MNVTFLVGNGFDLQNGLKTTFKDFFETVTKNNDDETENIIYREFNESFRSDPYTHWRDWSDFEKKLGALTEIITDKDSADTFMNDLDNLRDDFIDYMQDQEDKFEMKEKTSETIMIEIFSKFHLNLKDIEREEIIKMLKKTSNHRTVNIINFNYTNTLTKITESVRGKYVAVSPYRYLLRNQIYIHKTLNDGTFLGLDNREQINHKFFEEEDINSLIKPEAIDSDGTFDKTNAMNIIDTSHIIYIFGMFLGDSDKTWWNKIGEWLRTTNNSRLIINTYVGEEIVDIQKHPRRKFKHEKKIKDEFLNHLNFTDDELGRIRKRIYISVNSKYILNIN